MLKLTNGCGVTGLGGCWRITKGGAGGVSEFTSCCIMISPR